MSEHTKISSKQRFRLKQFIKELEDYRGRGTELVSVYVPDGYDINKIIQHLAQEQGTATNIKSSSTRKNVIDALERMIQHLRLYDKTPPNGLAAFSGNVAEREGQSDVQVWSIEPPLPMNQRLYRCDKEFILEPLQEIADDENTYGLIVLDKREGSIALLKGKTIIPLAHTQSAVPGKTKAGGQCLHPDTMVQMASGDIKPIKSVKEGDWVISMRSDGELEESLVLDSWQTKKTDLLKIEVEKPGMEIISSQDHIFFRERSGIECVSAGELKEGDWLIFPEKYAIGEKKFHFPQVSQGTVRFTAEFGAWFREQRTKRGRTQGQFGVELGIPQSNISSLERGEFSMSVSRWKIISSKLPYVPIELEPDITSTAILPQWMNASLAQILGYFVGDGNWDKTRICFCEQSENVARKYSNILASTLCCKPTLRYRKDKNYFALRANLGVVAGTIKNIFPEVNGSKDSLVPKLILEGGRSMQAAFLRGLFDADGTISRGRVSIGLHNEQLIHQVQLMLLSMGIISSLQKYDNNANPYSNEIRFTLDISEPKSLENFRGLIGFTSSDRTQKLNNSINSKTHRSSVRQIIENGSEVRKIIENHNSCCERYPRVTNFFRDERQISKQAFQSSLVEVTSNQALKAELQSIHDIPILRAKIKSIEPLQGIHDVVDISVFHQNFIANGLIVHNSAQRFERLRDGAAKDFYRRVGDYANKEFLHNKELKGILVGGPGRSKEEFVDQGQLNQELKDKILTFQDLSYTGEFGLQELLEKSEDVLAEEDVVEEKQAMQMFFQELSKSTGKASYGKDDVMRLTKMGAVDTLLLSEKLDDKLINEFEKEAENVGSETIIISLETREGAQLKEMGGVAAILRYAMEI